MDIGRMKQKSREGSNTYNADDRYGCKNSYPPAQLSSPDKETRERGFTLLETWLSQHRKINENDMRKIWQGLLCCLWYADSRVWQLYLIKRIGSVFRIIHPSISIPFFFAFLCTLSSRWDGFDKGKINRFHSLLQTCLSHMFMPLQREWWKKEIVKGLNDCFLETTLISKEYHLAHSINMYISQVFFDGLRKLFPLSYASKQSLEPLWKIFAALKDDVLLQRARDCCSLHFIEEAQRIQEEAEEYAIFKVATNPIRLPAVAAPLNGEYSRASELFGASNTFAVVKVEAVLVEADNQLRSTKTGSREVLQQTITVGTQIQFCEAVSTDESTMRHLSKEMEESLSTEERPSEVSVSSLELVNETRNDEDSNCNQEKGPILNKKKRKKVSVDMENHVSRSPKRRRLLQSSETNSPRISRKFLQEICNRFEGAVKGGNGGEKAKGERLVSQGVNIIYIDEKNDSISLLPSPMSSMLLPSPTNKGRKRRKSRELVEGLTIEENVNDTTNGAVSDCCMLQEKKKVKFSLEDNIVWQPPMPLPPKDIRVPPSARPRGSALKKGSLPGPIHIQRVRNYSPKKSVSTKKTSKGPGRAPKRRRHVNPKQLKK